MDLNSRSVKQGGGGSEDGGKKEEGPETTGVIGLPFKTTVGCDPG